MMDLAPRLGRRLAGGLLAVGLAGCPEPGETAESFRVPTSISVVPADFLGDVACGPQPGALQTYVATITDVTEDVPPFTVPSSAPVGCSDVAAFRFVLPEHLYRVEIDAYETGLGGELVPLGGHDSGARQMLLGGAPVPPRWTTRCGFDAPVEARFDESVAVQPCDPLVDHGTPGATAITIDPKRTLAGVACEGRAFDVRPIDSELPAALGVGCDDPDVLLTAGVEPDRRYGFRVTSGAGDAAAVATCTAETRAGLTVPVTCTPLTSGAAVEVRLAEVLPTDGACLARVVLRGPEPASVLRSPPSACGDIVRFAPLVAGDYDAEIFVANGNGAFESEPRARCSVLATAGATTSADCRLE